MRWTLLGALLAVVVAAPASAALRCKNWVGLDDAQKQERILDEIDAVLSSNTAKRYTVNKVRIRKCLEWRTTDIVDQFDGICAEGKRAPMNALDTEFDRYISTCVARRGP